MEKKKMIAVGVLVVFLGIVTGGVLSGKLGSPQSNSNMAPGTVVSDKEAGSADEKTFNNTATGILREGGIKGEGTHHLERPGGASQTAYLTSTVIDLGSFVGKKVQVWGETVAGKYAGWLMDIGKVKVVE